MTFFFRSLLISCKIIPFSLVLYVSQKGSLCGATLRNSSFSPCLTMSRMYLSEVILFQFSRKSFMLPAWKLSALLIEVFITFFLISCVCPLPDFLIPVLELVFVSLSLLWLLLEGSFCRDSSREALEVFWIWVILVSAKIGTVSLVISTVIWCDINLASFVTGLQELYSVVKIIAK